MRLRSGRLSRPLGAANSRIAVNLNNIPAPALRDLLQFPDLALDRLAVRVNAHIQRCIPSLSGHHGESSLETRRTIPWAEKRPLLRPRGFPPGTFRVVFCMALKVGPNRF